ncbi:MAG: response regulator [Bdellovibrionaceae bacterium]|nr:response regulator [Pseudobdellovibrionaceae bacterium]
MSHEIRTPMNAILGFTEIMKHDNLTSAQRKEFVSIIQRNTQALCSLIDSILDLSKIEAGKFQTETLTFSPNHLIKDVIELLKIKAKEKNIQLLHSEDNLPEFISSDSNKIRQILINIIGNAVKFTTQGSVVVTSNYKPSGKSSGLLEIEVQDTGIGISLEQRDKLFRDFTQANFSTTRKFGGTGLGLSLSRRIAQKLGGNIELLESKDGSGSKFLISVLVEIALEQNIENKDERFMLYESLRGKRLLLVEDSPDNQALITHFLKPYQIELAIASDGLSGANMALYSPFDIILMDIQMPGMDGFEALQVLRKKSYQGKVFALTAHAMVEERQKCMNAGFDGFLSKPISRETLIKSIAEVLTPKNTRNSYAP